MEKSKVKSKISVGLITTFLLSSLVFVLTFTETFQTVSAAPRFLNVSIYPEIVKLPPFQTQIFTATSDGKGSVIYTWYAKALKDTLVNINDANVSVSFEPRQIALGKELSFSFPEATPNVVLLTVQVVDKRGCVGYADTMIYDPYSSSGVYIDALPSMATYVCEADGKGWFRAISKIGHQDTSSTNDDSVLQYAINQTTSTGGIVYVRAGTYSASVTMKDNVCFVLDYGVSGVTYSIDTGADCTIIDYSGKLRRDYSGGSLVYQFDYSTGNELITSANITTLYVGTIDQVSSSGVKVLKLIVQNGTSFPSSPLECQVFFRTDLGCLYIRNNSAWTQIGATAYSNLTGTPDLTVYLTKDGLAALTGNWNIGGSYGIYGATWLNSTSINAQNWYMNGVQLGFLQPATFIIDASGSTYRMWYGANSTLAYSSTTASQVINNAIGNLTSGIIYIKGNNETWVLKERLDIINKSISIICEPLLKAANAFSGHEIIRFYDCHDFYFWFCKLDGNKANNNGADFENLLLEGCTNAVGYLKSIDAPCVDLAFTGSSGHVNKNCKVHVDAENCGAYVSSCSIFSNEYNDAITVSGRSANNQHQAIYCGTENFFLENFEAYNCSSDALDFRSGTVAFLTNVVANLTIGGATDALSVSEGAVVHAVNLVLNNSGARGIMNEGQFFGTNIRIIGSAGESFSTSGGSDHVQLQNFYIESTAKQYGISVASNSAGHHLFSNGKLVTYYGINENEPAHTTIYSRIDLMNVTSDKIGDAGMHLIDCYGFVTKNSGTATISNGQTSVTFAHGLAGTPALVCLGATHAEVADAIWSADATNITITVPSAVTANRNISWYAEYKP